MDTKYSGTIKTRRKKASIKSQRLGIYAICAYYNRATTSKHSNLTSCRNILQGSNNLSIIFGHLDQAALLEKRVEVMPITNMRC